MDQVFNWSRPGCKLVDVKLLWNIKVPFLKTKDRTCETLNSLDLREFLKARDLLKTKGRPCETLSSPELFAPQETPKSKWRLEVDNRNLQIGISVIHFNSTGTVGYFVQPALVKMSILERNGRKVFQQLVPSSRNSPVVQFFVSKESLMQSECLQLDGSLTFCCKIFTHVEPVPSTFSFFYAASFLAIDRSNGPSTRSSYLFNSGQPTDVIFKVRGRELPAHRRILIARSEVFAAMFQHPMEERSTNVAKIEDIDPDVFHELLHFIYTGQVQLEKLEKMAVSLFIAADKYLLDVLKLKCENYLSNHISPENCAVLLFHGDLSITSIPLTNAAKYFRSFPHQVMSTNEWKKNQQETLAGLHDIFKFVYSP